MGNPLYIRETLDQLLQDGNLKVWSSDRPHDSEAKGDTLLE